MNYNADYTTEKIMVMQCLQQISVLDSFQSMTDFFLDNYYYLNEYTIINATDCPQSTDLYSVFDGIENIRDQLYTPFFSGKINAINARIAKRALKSGNGKFFSIRCISFDTQTVSYLYRYYIKQVNSLPRNIKSVLNVIKKRNIDVDYIPYSMENLMFSEEKNEEVWNSIFAFEKLYDNKASDEQCAKNTDKIINLYKKIKDEGTFEPLRLYPLLYAVLLKMCIIQIKHTSLSVNQKMRMLRDFMNDEVCRILLPELILAKRYFEKGQAYSFFGKVQKGRNDLLKTIRNMTWDIMHLRTLEIDFTINPVNASDANIPYFFTYDKHLLEVKECYELSSIAINDRTGERFPFYKNMDEIKKYIIRYSGLDERCSRRQRVRLIVMDEIIGQLEKIIMKL